MARRKRVEPTDEWPELELLLEWPEQVEYERIRPPVVFGSSVAERSRQTGTPRTTLRRRIASFEDEGMRGLFEPERVEGKSALAPEVRRLILDLKAEHPPMRDNEIATVCSTGSWCRAPCATRSSCSTASWNTRRASTPQR